MNNVAAMTFAAGYIIGGGVFWFTLAYDYAWRRAAFVVYLITGSVCAAVLYGWNTLG